MTRYTRDHQVACRYCRATYWRWGALGFPPQTLKPPPPHFKHYWVRDPSKMSQTYYDLYRTLVCVVYIMYRCDFLRLLFSEGTDSMKPQTGRSNTHILQLASTLVPLRKARLSTSADVQINYIHCNRVCDYKLCLTVWLVGSDNTQEGWLCSVKKSEHQQLSGINRSQWWYYYNTLWSATIRKYQQFSFH